MWQWHASIQWHNTNIVIGVMWTTQDIHLHAHWPPTKVVVASNSGVCVSDCYVVVVANAIIVVAVLVIVVVVIVVVVVTVVTAVESEASVSSSYFPLAYLYHIYMIYIIITITRSALSCCYYYYYYCCCCCCYYLLVICLYVSHSIVDSQS